MLIAQLLMLTKFTNKCNNSIHTNIKFMQKLSHAHYSCSQMFTKYVSANAFMLNYYHE